MRTKKRKEVIFYIKGLPPLSKRTEFLIVVSASLIAAFLLMSVT